MASCNWLEEERMEAARDGSLASLPLWLGDTRTTFGMATREAVKLAIERCLSKVCTIIDGARAPAHDAR